MKRADERALAACARSLARRGASPETVRVVGSSARLFLAAIGKTARRVKAADLRAHLARCHVRGLSAVTISATLVRLRIFFRALVEAGLARTDPTEGLHVKPPARRAQLLLSSDEVRRLLVASAIKRRGMLRSRAIVRALALRDRATIELLVGLGLRRAEAADIRISDLDFSDGSLLVRAVKRGAQRRLPLPRASLAPLAEYLEDARPVLAAEWRRAAGDFFLLSFSGGRLGGPGVGQVVKSVAARAGVRARPHAFRRALATHLVRGGVTVETVRQVLGHTDLASTAIYAEIDREDMRRAVEALELAETVNCRAP